MRLHKDKNMAIADKSTYLAEVIANLKTHWPENRLSNIVCHGHSVPAGYFATPMVDTFNAYPHLLHQALKSLYPFAVINVIVTAIGGETSLTGAERFERDVLCHNPEVLTIDYSLNDRGSTLEAAEKSWRSMTERAIERGVKVILMTPTPDIWEIAPNETTDLQRHAEQVRRLADEYGVGLSDSLAAFEGYVRSAESLTEVMSWSNHPNRKGHELVVTELMRWFPVWA